MKKALLLITLMHLPVSAMEEEVHPPAYEKVCDGNTAAPFELEDYLKEHNWRERKDALTKDQREELGEYLEVRQQERKTTDLADIDLATILMDGLKIAEKKKSPAELDELLHRGIIEDSAKKVSRAIRGGANVEKGKGDKPPILWATLLKRSDAVRELLYDNNYAEKAIHLMYNNQHIGTYVSDIDTAIAFMKKGLPISDRIMRLAIESDSEELIQLSVNHQRYKAKKLSREEWGMAFKNPKALKVILDQGFDPNQKPNNGSTPLIVSAIQNTRERAYGNKFTTSSEDAIESIRTLLDAGTDIKTPNLLGEAIRCNHPAIELLIERGATL